MLFAISLARAGCTSPGVCTDRAADPDGFVPRHRLRKSQRSKSKEHESQAADTEGETPPLFYLPQDLTPETGFVPSVRKARWSNVHDAIDSTLEAYYQEFEHLQLHGDMPTISIPPGEGALLFLAFPVGFVEHGVLTLALAPDEAVEIDLAEALGER